MSGHRVSQSKQSIAPEISWWWITGILALMLAANYWVWRTASSASVHVEDRTGDPGTDVPSYHQYATLLAEFVDGRGIVDYRGLKQRPTALESFLSTLEKVRPESYAEWSEKDQVAFWINTYNAITLKAVVDHYPIESSFLTSLRFPENSIRQISGVWDKLLFSVMGQELTLDQIEHKILRPEFKDPRVHAALVCAALGCPPLRREPYLGSQLDAQLDDQSRRFLAQPDKFRINRKRGRVFLSSILKWYGEDFVPAYATQSRFGNRDPAERAVLNFVAGFLNDNDRAYLKSGHYEVEYLDYDWSLNEHPLGR